MDFSLCKDSLALINAVTHKRANKRAALFSINLPHTHTRRTFYCQLLLLANQKLSVNGFFVDINRQLVMEIHRNGEKGALPNQ